MKKIFITTLLMAGALSVPTFAATSKQLVNIRKSPSINSEVLFQLGANKEVKIIGKEMSWYKVEVGDKIGYAVETLITAEKEILDQYNNLGSSYSLISEFKTSFSKTDTARNHNIEKAAYQNNVVVKNGGTFSFNKNTGNSTVKSNGWAEAPIIAGGELVLGVGGGICQTSSTIYGAIRKVDGVKIIQQRPHSKRVGYTTIDNEAMVSFGSSDLVWKNDTGADIAVVNTVNQSAGTIVSRIYIINP